MGLVKPDEGKVYLNDEDITKLPMYKRAQMGIGYLPQEASVFRKLSVEDNIRAVLEMTKLTRVQQKEKLESLLAEFRLQHVRKSPGDVLSGGERRRTEIARALAVNPKFILLDEPFAGIDPIAVEDIQAIVARLKYKNIGILITDHNVTETLSITDRAYLMFEGKLLKAGTAEELATDEQVKSSILAATLCCAAKTGCMMRPKERQPIPFLIRSGTGATTDRKTEMKEKQSPQRVRAGKKSPLLQPIQTHLKEALAVSIDMADNTKTGAYKQEARLGYEGAPEWRTMRLMSFIPAENQNNNPEM